MIGALPASSFLWLADLNASLNLASLVCLVLALAAIRRGRIVAHKRWILAAATLSAAFLVSYVTYHLNAPPVRYGGSGALRAVYLVILISHIVLAVVQVPLILTTIVLGLKDRRERHRRWARVTAPIWLYVSFTGVLVYLFLYVFPQSP